MHTWKFFLVIISISLYCNTSSAVGEYQVPKEFIHDAFVGDPPKINKLWIKGELKKRVHNIMKHDLDVLRLKYWKKGERTAWILEEIGKERPITVGIIVNRYKIETIKVLIFRESRGWEIRYPFFTDQFKDIALKNTHQLDAPIDGISGATLSVNAMKKMAQLALLLHQHVMTTVY